MDRRYVPGLVLIIGTLLLAAYAFTGHYGLLVPGGIMTGLGAGFLLIYVVDRARGTQRPGGSWPVIPGGILVTIGVVQAARAAHAVWAIGTWWPVLLILLGVWLLLRPRAAA